MIFGEMSARKASLASGVATDSLGHKNGTMTATSTTIDQDQLVDEAIEALLRNHDPTAEGHEEFRGHRYDAGLAFVHFPVGFGGLGVRPELNRTVESRLRKAGAAPPESGTFFMLLAGPTIATHGTDEQKHRFLRPMFTGAERWCQLFSEPGAGSDFAGLATRAIADGDEWVVNGQKVWNTLAHTADWGMLVTRSDPEVPKHKGMTYFSLDMHSEGVEVRPLRQITGEAEFNEVYLTDVRIPDAHRIGGVAQGWGVALTTLMNERSAIGGTNPGGAKPTDVLLDAYQNMDPDTRTRVHLDKVMRLWVQAEALRLTGVRAAQNLRANNPGPEGSVTKLMGAELNKRLRSVVVDLEGPAGMIDYDYTFRQPDDVMMGRKSDDSHHEFLRSRANSIEGGTSEIMRNILGEQVLGLPGEPRVDKLVAWSEVPRN